MRVYRVRGGSPGPYRANYLAPVTNWTTADSKPVASTPSSTKQAVWSMPASASVPSGIEQARPSAGEGVLGFGHPSNREFTAA